MPIHRTLLALALATALPAVAGAQSRPAPPPDDMRAAPDRPGWSVDPRTGCWVWNGVPQPNQTVSWSAGCGPDGRATGRGVVEWRYDGKVDRYEGEYRDGKRHGQGVYTSANGDRYEGEYRDGKGHGRGVYTWASGNRYDGEWRDGKRHGQGVQTWVYGDRYEGEYRDDRPDGFGVAWIGGEQYAGSWAEGCFRDGNRRTAIGRPVSECP